MKYQVYNIKAEKIKEVELNPSVFEVKENASLIHQVVIAQLANKRRPIAHAKDKSEVRGGGKKPWKQKGTGRARHGSSRSPIWVGGGVTFGPNKNQNFSQKINKKMKRKALFMCLTDRAQDNNLILVDKLDVSEIKTKTFIKTVKNLKDILNLQKVTKKSAKPVSTKGNSVKTKATDDKGNKTKKFNIKDYKTSILVVAHKNIPAVSKTARNIPGIKVVSPNSLNVVDILAHQKLLMVEDSLEQIEKTYLKKRPKS